jgi:hypothetical protein
METVTSLNPIKRRLTAIFAADAVGYSRRMSENEEATRRVLAVQRAIIDRLIVAHEGRIFGTAGDSVLAEEMKLKLQVAEAQRARAEAELARSRADAELAKQRNASLRTGPKSDAPPSPPQAAAVDQARSTTAAPASPVAASPTPDTPGVSKTPATPLTPVPEQKTPPPAAAEAVRAIPASPPKSPPPVPALNDSHRGLAILSCGPFDELPAFTTAIPVRVLNDEIVVEKGKPEKPGYVLVHGRPSPEGRLVLDGMIVAAAKRFRGQQTRVRYEGAYREGTYELVGFHGLRRCTMAIRMDNQP